MSAIVFGRVQIYNRRVFALSTSSALTLSAGRPAICDYFCKIRVLSNLSMSLQNTCPQPKVFDQDECPPLQNHGLGMAWWVEPAFFALEAFLKGGVRCPSKPARNLPNKKVLDTNAGKHTFDLQRQRVLDSLLFIFLGFRSSGLDLNQNEALRWRRSPRAERREPVRSICFVTFVDTVRSVVSETSRSAGCGALPEETRRAHDDCEFRVDGTDPNMSF